MIVDDAWVFGLLGLCLGFTLSIIIVTTAFLIEQWCSKDHERCLFCGEAFRPETDSKTQAEDQHHP
jgi:hypothetical protein